MLCIILYSRVHRGSLEDSLKTRKMLTIKEFNALLPHYHFYAFDERINSIMFILEDMEHKFRVLPTWLEINLSKVDF